MRRWSIVGLLAVAVPAGAAAQSLDTHRVYIAVNGGLQPTATDFSEAATFAGPSPVYTEVVSGAATGEPSSFSGTYSVDSGAVFDISGGVRLWRNLGAGVSLSGYRSDTDANIAARLPHPFFLSSARTVAGSSPLSHEQQAMHIHALVTHPVNPALTVTVFGGPTVFTVWQDLVTDVRFTHSYPYDDAVFAGIVSREESQSAVGFNVGADVSYYFNETIGVGWLTRFSRATIDLPSVGDRNVEVPAGGLHAVGGLRLRF